MMRSLGLPTSAQFVVFGVVIIGGMLVSGDRIIKGVEQVLRDRTKPGRAERGGRRRRRRSVREGEMTEMTPEIGSNTK